MPQNLTVTALAMWGLFALGVIVGTCYCYYSDNHLDEKLGVSKGKAVANATATDDTATKLNALLTSLRNAKVIAV